MLPYSPPHHYSPHHHTHTTTTPPIHTHNTHTTATCVLTPGATLPFFEELSLMRPHCCLATGHCTDRNQAAPQPFLHSHPLIAIQGTCGFINPWKQRCRHTTPYPPMPPVPSAVGKLQQVTASGQDALFCFLSLQCCTPRFSSPRSYVFTQSRITSWGGSGSSNS